MPRHEQAQVVIAYALFVLVGLGAGTTGVLLLAQIRDYGVDQATIGITFFTGSAGFVLGGASAGALIGRFGTRAALLASGAAFTLAAIYIATRPPFAAFVLVQVVVGYAYGVQESVLNVHLTTLPRTTTRLNRLHGFFGVGALLGPLAATGMLTFTTWPMVPLALAAVGVPLMLAVAVSYPRGRVVTGAAGEPAPQVPVPAAPLSTALRQRAILLGTVMLAVYVGFEISVGNWAYSYLVQARGASETAAGYTVSAYWLGLTLGRFLISPAAGRIGLTTAGLMYTCLVGVTATAGLTWLVPAALAGMGFVLLGFFLGPIFPTTMAIAPRLTTTAVVPTAIGVMNAGSVVGGAVLPWLAGALAHGVGPSTLLPYAVVLGLAQLVVWWRIAGRTGAPVAAAEGITP